MSSKMAASDALSSQKVYKKSSPNNKLTLYLGTRDLIISDKSVDKIQGVVLAEPDYLQNRKIYGQVTLTFRYGREDEEVMGLKFCNEAVMCLAQLYPPHERAPVEPNTPLQDALIKRLGPNAHPFTMTVTHLAPPSVQLVPAKEYSGAPIGTSYDVRAYAADRSDEKLHRRSTVRMGIRVVQMPSGSGGGPEAPAPSPQPPPRLAAEKQFLLSDGKLKLEAELDKSVYCHGDPVIVSVHLQNNSNRTVRRLKAFIVQHVDVCMFSNGKFKNVVAMMNCCNGKCPLGPGATLEKSYSLRPVKGATKNWIALEDSYNKANTSLASTVICNSPEERNVFAIYVSYYVKVKATASGMGGDVSVKLPFVLMHSPSEAEPGTEVVAPSEPTPPPSPGDGPPIQPDPAPAEST